MKSLLIISMLLSLTTAWWDKGHLLTARIAQLLLEEENGSVGQQKFNRTLEILHKLKITDPAWTNSENKNPFTECATFADQIKNKGGAWQKGWHFIDEPYLDQGGDISDFDFKADSHNITEVISALVDMFNQADGYKNSYEYKQLEQHAYHDKNESNLQSTAMRFLIHYVGDVHQPLHATSRVNPDYKQGDFGGNLVKLPSISGAGNLHAVWDSVIYTYTGYVKLPFTDSAWDELTSTAKTLLSSIPIQTDEAKNLDPKYWAAESFELSKTVVYPDITPMEEPSDDYKQKALEVAKKQIVMGGHRLANLIMSLKMDVIPDTPATMEEEPVKENLPVPVADVPVEKLELLDLSPVDIAQIEIEEEQLFLN